jgi:pimeloyl-ACP methyl ester carboxylesterase
MADEAGTKTVGVREYEAQPPVESLPPELRAPLSAFRGEPPPAPAWFTAALAQTPEQIFVATPRGKLEAFVWGDVGKPGLLLVHGNFASADWWSWVAPFFAADYRIAAMSLAGMGMSDWREAYDFEGFSADAEAVARAAGLYAGGDAPLYIGHSFGGGLIAYAAAKYPERMSGAILVDSGFRVPSQQILQSRIEHAEARRAPPDGVRGFPSLALAVAKFRLLPAQPVENLYILDQIARTSVKPVATPTGEAWPFKYDPELAFKVDYAARGAFFASSPGIKMPVAHLYGQHSSVVEPGRLGPLPTHVLQVEIPEAHHHVMIDQPLALVSALRAVLAAWRP